MRAILALGGRALLCAIVGLQAACATVNSVTGGLLGPDRPPPGVPGNVEGFLGGAVADEPRAAVVAREVLSAGGNAADAAVAAAFTLSVTLPSRAGLGASGACLAYAPGRRAINAGVPEAILFTAVPAGTGPRADRPAALPMLPRGMFVLHARYGKRPFESLIAPAEQLARLGVPASRALVSDLAVVRGALLADPGARAVFARGGQMLEEGVTLVQPDLGASLAQLRTGGVGELYQGSLGRRLEDASPLIGGPVTLQELRSAVPLTAPPIILAQGNDRVAFPPPPADGGLAAAAAFAVLQANPADMAGAEERARAVAAAWRMRGGDPMALLREPVSAGGLPALPATTSLVALDKDGNAVVCALSMGNLFGTGRIVPGMGFLLAASPERVPPPLLAVGLAYNQNVHGFRAAVGGAGQEGAPMAVAAGLMNTLRTQQPMAATVPEPGRANVIACARYLPGSERFCAWAADPRGFGLAQGGG